MMMDIMMIIIVITLTIRTQLVHISLLHKVPSYRGAHHYGSEICQTHQHFDDQKNSIQNLDFSAASSLIEAKKFRLSFSAAIGRPLPTKTL